MIEGSKQLHCTTLNICIKADLAVITYEMKKRSDIFMLLLTSIDECLVTALTLRILYLTVQETVH